MTVDSIQEKSPIPQLPKPQDVLNTPLPFSFPFEEMDVWTEAFNHMKIQKGKRPEVEEKKGNIIPFFRNKDKRFTLYLPEKPTLGQILAVTSDFIAKAQIEVDNPRLLIFSRDLRNQARLLAQLVTQSLPQEEQEKVSSLIISLYHLGQGLEMAVKRKEYQPSTSISLESLSDESSYELPKGADIQRYQDELFLRLLGKNQAYFDEKSLNDPKLSQISERSAYYYLLKRFIERKKPKPLPLKQQMEKFDQWLLDRKKILLSLLTPSFLNEDLSPLKEGGRTHTALWQNIFSSFFSYLDQAIETEGWQQAKEKLSPPPLFTDLGEDLQQMLKEIFPQDIDSLSFDTSRFYSEDAAQLVEEIKQKAEKTGYGKMSLFQLAETLLQKMLERNPNLTTYDKLSLLVDLVQAYEYQKTLKLTKALKAKAFECNLRSYILGRLCQTLLKDQVEVYAVLSLGHTFLLVFDKTTNQAYWVDPSKARFFYDKDKEGRITERYMNFPNLYIKPVDSKEWIEIEAKIQSHPDDFSVFGRFNNQFSVILPFRQGLESGFWNNLGFINLKNSKSEKDPKKRQQLLKNAYYCAIKEIRLNPNVPFSHHRLASLYSLRKLAEILGKSYGENLLKALQHYQKAIEIKPDNPDVHNNLAALYTEREFAEAQVKSENPNATEEEIKQRYLENLNQALLEMKKAFDLERTLDRYDRFFWVICQIPNNLAQEFFDSLPEETRQIILRMYQDKEMRRLYDSNFSNNFFSAFFEKALFWKIFSEKVLQNKQ